MQNDYLDSLPPVMTEEEAQNLYDDWDSQSWKVLAERNMRLAAKIASSYESTTSIELEELRGVAYLGLVKAAKRFDPTKKYSFSTFATIVIRNELNYMLRRRKQHVYSDLSIDDQYINQRNESYEMQDFLPGHYDLDDIINAIILKDTICEQLRELPSRDYQIVVRTMQGETGQRIAVDYGISQPTVHRIFKKFKEDVIRKVG